MIDRFRRLRASARSTPGNDKGSILPMVMVVTVVMSMVVISLATYTTVDLRFGRIVEDRADRLSAAEAGLRHMLEQEQEANSLCTTALGYGAGETMVIPDTISGASVQVHCRQVGSSLSSITAWAAVITGEGGVPDGQGLITQSGNGNVKVFGGPSFIARPSLLGISAPLEMREGNLWHTGSGCQSGGQYESNGSNASVFGQLTFSPASRGVWCTSRAWSDLFKEPGIGAVPAVTNPAPVNVGGCRVFSPGRYTTPPVWGPNNYMKSGDYYFNTGLINVDKTVVTAGREGVAGDKQQVDNTPCVAVRDADQPQGATFYMDGTSRFNIGVQGSLEILRRQHNYDFVSIQALSTHTLNYTTPILSTGSGNQKQMAIHGMVWAPRGSIVFGEVTNTAVAQLSGGVIVASLRADASASVSGFVIQVQGSPQSDKIAYTATATKNGTTQVRVIAQVRFSLPASGSGVGTWELVMNSWRVCDGLC